MRFVSALLCCFLIIGCWTASPGNTLDERLIARIDTDSLDPDGIAEVRFSNPSAKRYFHRIYLTADAVPDSVQASYRDVTGFLDRVESGLIGMRLEVVGVGNAYRNVTEFEADETGLQWSPSSDPIYGFWSGWPGEELPAGEYVFRLSLPNKDSAAQAVSVVTTEQVIYESGP